MMSCQRVEVQQRGTWVGVGLESESELCTHTAAHYDRVIETQAEALGLTIPRDFSVDLLFVEPSSIPSLNCGGGELVEGCVVNKGTVAYAGARYAAEHELAHALTIQTLGSLNYRLFSEGVAEALDPSAIYDPAFSMEPASDWCGTDVLSVRNYAYAGRFVSWLVREYGADKFQAFWSDAASRLCRKAPDSFEAHYNISLAEALSIFDDLGSEVVPLSAPGCSGIRLQPGATEEPYPTDCEHEMTWGSKSGELSPPGTTFVVEPEGAIGCQLELETLSGPRAYRCGWAGDDPGFVMLESGARTLEVLPGQPVSVVFSGGGRARVSLSCE